MRTATPSGRSSRFRMPSETAVRVEFPSAARTTSAVKSRVSPVLRPDSSSRAARTPVTRPSSAAQRLGDAVAFQHDGARGLGVPGQFLVEAEPGPDQSVLREVGDLGPGKFDAAAAGQQAQALVAAPALGFGVRQAEFLDLADGAGGEPVAADLFRGKAGLFQHRDVDAGLRQVVGGSGPGRTGSDDQYFHGGDELTRGPGDVAAQLRHRSGVGGQGSRPPAAGPDSAPGLTARCTATMPPLRLR